MLPKYLPESAISELLSQFDAGELTPAQSLDSGAWFRFVLHYMSPADHEIANRLTKKRKALQPALEINISQATHSTSPQHKVGCAWRVLKRLERVLNGDVAYMHECELKIGYHTYL